MLIGPEEITDEVDQIVGTTALTGMDTGSFYQSVGVPCGEGEVTDAR